MMQRVPVTSSIAAAILLMLSPATQAGEFDPFSVSLKVSAFPSKSMLPQEAEGVDPCSFPALGVPLGLVEAVERAMCHNPKTRQAWATAKVQAAELGVSRSAYLPTVNATFGVTKQNTKTSYAPPWNVYNVDANPTIRSGDLKLSLVLTDFGRTSASVDRAYAALDAANAAHDATLQAAFVTAAQAYFDTLTAISTLEAARQAENAAKESYMAAAAKYKAGIGTLADQLQAQTAYSKAKLDAVKADADVKNAQGTLAAAMGLPANTPIMVMKRDGKLPDISFVKPVDQLMEEAKQNHPGLISAKAQLEAALATVRMTRAEGRPSVVAGAEINRQTQLNMALSPGLKGDAFNTTKSISIQLNIPLFEGFGRQYKVMSAQGQAEAKAAELADAEQQVMLEVWKNYQSLTSETENMRMTDDLVRGAQQSFSVARGRYKAGVGNMLELLNAQTELASAEQKRIQSVSNWHTARLKVAQSIGKLGLWAIQ